MYNLASHQASEYLLHNAPMLLVDEILQVSDTHIEVKIEINEKHQLFFNQAQQVPVWVSIELMAQAVGTWAGVQSKIKDNSQAQIGFLLGTRQCKHFVSHYQMHEILRVYAHLLIQDQRMASFDVKIINSQNQVTAEGRLTTYQPDQNELGQLLNKE